MTYVAPANGCFCPLVTKPVHTVILVFPRARVLNTDLTYILGPIH